MSVKRWNKGIERRLLGVKALSGAQGILALAALMLMLGGMAIPAAAGSSTYPLPPSGSTVTSTFAVSFTGFGGNSANVNVSQTTPNSPVSNLNFDFKASQSNLNLQVEQLAGTPTSVLPPPAVAGSPVLSVFFGISPQVDASISSVVITFQIPLSAISALGYQLGSGGFYLTVEHYNSTSGTWTNISAKVVGEGSDYITIQATSPGLSLFEVLVSQQAASSSSTTASGASSTTSSPSTSMTSTSSASTTSTASSTSATTQAASTGSGFADAAVLAVLLIVIVAAVSVVYMQRRKVVVA